MNNKNLNIALEAARAGAKVVLENFGKSTESKVKGNSKGLVTQTDLEAEQAILGVLSTKSNYKILSEESGTRGFGNGPVWVVDPLDGTTNFAHSLPFFAVSVGLMQGSDSLAGAIIDPVRNNEYYAAKGNGAFCNGIGLKIPKYNAEYIPTVFLNHGYDEADRLKFKILAEKLASSHNILKLGTTALELCYIASGSADAFICSGDEIWDFAAGIVIAQEAGCVFTDWKGNPWDGKENHLLFARPGIHNYLVKKITDLQ
jgi:myo-inositol-1(or 4)-monophosphatase